MAKKDIVPYVIGIMSILMLIVLAFVMSYESDVISNRIDQLKQDSIRCHKVIREQNTILKNVHKNCVVMGE